MIKMAFAGFRHPHIQTLYKLAQENPRVEIVAAVETNEVARKEAEEALGVTFTHDSLEALLQEEAIDLVAFGDAYGARGVQLIAALSHGKHVYADKPVCTRLWELDEICRLQQETGKKVGCMLDMRYLPWVEPVRRFLANGALGEIHQVSFGGQHPLLWGKRAAWYFEKGMHGGTINDIAVHGIDLVEYFTGKTIESIECAREWNAFAQQAPEFKDAAQFMVTLTGQTGLMADVSYAAPDSCGYKTPYYWRFVFWGEKGVLECNYNSEKARVWLNGSETEEFLPEDSTPRGNCLDVFLDEMEGKSVPIDTAWTLRLARELLLLEETAGKVTNND